MLHYVTDGFVPPLGSAYDVAARVIPHGGGDAIAAGRRGTEVFLALFDGAGNGVQAAPLAALAYQALGAEWSRPAPGEWLSWANQRYCRAAEALEHDPFSPLVATALAVRLCEQAGAFWLASAGHPTAYLAGVNGARALPLDPGPPLGVDGDAAFGTAEFRWPPQEALVLVTDGVLDARGPRARRLGVEGMAALLGALGSPTDYPTSSALVDAIGARVWERWEPSGDSSIVVVRRGWCTEGLPTRPVRPVPVLVQGAAA